jgi:myo-inositol-1-phosphate synthase
MSTFIESKRLTYTSAALIHIGEAQKLLKQCGAVNAHAAVLQAKKSVEGAVRHAQRLNHLGDEDLLKMKRHRKAHRRKGQR